MEDSQSENTEALFAAEMTKDSRDCFLAFGVRKDCDERVRCWRTVLYLISSNTNILSASSTNLALTLVLLVP